MNPQAKTAPQLRTYGMLGVLLLVAGAFAWATGGTFLSPRNLSMLSQQMAVTGMAAAGMVLLIVAGQIDLSAGALAGLCGGLAAHLCARAGWPFPAALAAALAAGCALGALQGSLVAFLAIPPFIVTLGGMQVLQGALLGFTGGVSVVPPETYLALGRHYLSPPLTWGLAGAAAGLLLGLGRRRPLAGLGGAALALGAAWVFNLYQGLPLAVLLLLVLAALLWFTAEHTPFGRHLVAIGGNREAAFYAGVPIRARLVAAFALMGGVSALAGLVLCARVGAATPDAGRMLELDAIAAAVIGGTSLLGGRGSVWGALLGAAVTASLDNGLSLLNVEYFWQPVIKGAILVAAVGADIAARGSKKGGA